MPKGHQRVDAKLFAEQMEKTDGNIKQSAIAAGMSPN